MADTYLEFSAEMAIPKGKLDAARKIIRKMGRKLETYTRFAEVDPQKNTIWFHCEESIDLEEVVEPMARALIEGMETSEPFFLEWSYTCDHPVCGQFGGGAFVIMRGFETFWISPGEIAENWVKKRKEDLLAKEGRAKGSKGIKRACEDKSLPVLRALTGFVETVEATGGLLRDRKGQVAPVADPDWIDLGQDYLVACDALGRKPKIEDEKNTL